MSNLHLMRESAWRRYKHHIVRYKNTQTYENGQPMFDPNQYGPCARDEAYDRARTLRDLGCYKEIRVIAVFRHARGKVKATP